MRRRSQVSGFRCRAPGARRIGFLTPATRHPAKPAAGCPRHPTPRQPNPPSLAAASRHGFTLLEIIISLAILAGSLAALGEVMRSAARSATMAEDETQAQILAESIMDELQAGSRELTVVEQSPLDTPDDPPWVYSVALDQTDYDELVAVRVRVEQQVDARFQPAHFELVRWMPNPDYVPPDTGDQQGNTSSSTGNSTGASGGAG